MRAPAESMNQTIGMRQRRASSRQRVTLVSPTKPIDPPFTVKSYAAAATGRPLTLPQPQITASAGGLSFGSPAIWVPWMPISK
jgi:hypothetical protein